MSRDKRPAGIVLTVLLFLMALPAQAVVKQYIRDYRYKADDFDTRYTCRIRAIDGVKQNLLEELGTYVQSVIRVSENSDGSKSVTHDYVNLAAGVLSTEILKEDWDRISYYVQAKMLADPDEVHRALQAMRDNIRLEQALRESVQQLADARKKISELQQQMKQQQSVEKLADLNRDYVRAAQALEVEYQYQHALRYIIEGDFERAYKLLEALSEKGYDLAQVKLGHMFERGMGREPDYDMAAQWYLKAINHGSARAKTHLGFLYERGLGVRQDFDKAVALYRQAVAEGDYHGQSRLAMLYLKGAGVKRDTARALQLAQASVAHHKHGRGYTVLGYMYERGIEVEKDFQQAAAYYEKAARRGNPQGMARLAWMYARGRGVAQNIDKAWALIHQAERYHNPFALMVKGFMYEKGLGVDSDYEVAIKLYRESAHQESAAAMYRLGKVYEKGRGVDEDIDTAISWYRRAAELGHRKSRKQLAELLGDYDLYRE